MLAKKFKLPIQKINFRDSEIVRDDYFLIKTISNNFNFSRFGVIVSSKIFKRAVLRNKARRIIFNFIKDNNFHLNPGSDILIIVSPKIIKLTKEEIQEKIKKVLRK